MLMLNVNTHISHVLGQGEEFTDAYFGFFLSVDNILVLLGERGGTTPVGNWLRPRFSNKRPWRWVSEDKTSAFVLH